MSALPQIFPLQVAAKRSALVLLRGIYSCCLFIPLSPTQGPILFSTKNYSNTIAKPLVPSEKGHIYSLALPYGFKLLQGCQ